MMSRIIRSRENAVVRQLIALAHSARDRKKLGLTVLDGIHLIRAYADALGAPQRIAVAESAVDRDEVRALLAQCGGADVLLLADPLMAEISSLESPAFVVATIRTPEVSPLATGASMLVLEDLQDPGNVGSLLRSAAAAGIREVVTSRSTAFAWSPKVLRAAQGAHFTLNISEGRDLLEVIAGYAGTSIALVVDPEPPATVYDCDLVRPVAFLIGNEGAGLSSQLRRVASVRVTIPMPGRTESLNAAAAGAVCMFEMVRQRAHVPNRRG